MKPGLSTLSFTDQPFDLDLLDAFKKAGVQAIELSDLHPGFSYDNIQMFKDLRKKLNILGMHLNSIHIHLEKFDSNFNLSTSDEKQRDKTLAVYLKSVDVMESLGGDILVTHDIRIPEPASAQNTTSVKTTHDSARANFLKNLGEIAHYAESKNIRMALENTPRGYTRKPKRLVRLIEDLGALNVGICIDTGHRNLAGDPAEALQIAGRHLITLHIHDNHGENDEHLLPGRGNINWHKVVEMLRVIKYKGIFMYELKYADDLSSLRANFEYLWD